MKNITIKVSDKIATNQNPTASIVCGNSDYTVSFEFDEEWNGYPIKTARFAYRRRAELFHIDVPFSGNTVSVPILSDIGEVFVGVFSGNLCTTTPAKVRCEFSILCGGGTHEEPQEDVYNQIVALIQSGAVKGPPGADGGYYTPSVTKPSGDTMRMEFTPSGEDMPAVEPVEVELPAGPPGHTPVKGVDYFDGSPGATPHIGQNGNWFIGETDTGVKAQGEDGADGQTPVIGENGNWWIGGEDTGLPSRGETGPGAEVDPTLTQPGKAADAQVVGNELKKKQDAPAEPGADGQVLGLEDGVPKWVEQSGGVSGDWELIADITLSEDAAYIDIENSKEYKKLAVFGDVYTGENTEKITLFKYKGTGYGANLVSNNVFASSKGNTFYVIYSALHDAIISHSGAQNYGGHPMHIVKDDSSTILDFDRGIFTYFTSFTLAAWKNGVAGTLKAGSRIRIFGM